MNVTFRIEYKVQANEQLGVRLSPNSKPLVLSTADGYQWEGTFDLNLNKNTLFEYRYVVLLGDQVIREELGRIPHCLYPAHRGGLSLVISDSWRDLPYASYLFSSAFSSQELACQPKFDADLSGAVVVRALCPSLSKQGLRLMMVGEGALLGEWVPQRGLPMTEVYPNVWQAVLSPDKLSDVGAYKFVSIQAKSLEVSEWESGENRRLFVPNTESGAYYYLREQEVYFPSTNIRVAGTAIPVFSLRSEGSQGVGDFGDLHQMVDWCLKTKQRVLQILPINDTTATHTKADSYPYNSISIYAFHPMYIDLRQLGGLKDAQLEEQFQQRFRALNALLMVDYEATNIAKREYLRCFFEEQGEEVMQSEDAKQFVKDNNSWLLAYATFSYLRDQYNTSDFRAWPQYSTYNAEEVERLARNNKNVAFYCFMQYLLHQQLSAVSQYASEKGIILKGDIPIGISRCSVEAWVEPHYFNMNGQAGAPPDAFSANGQNWGFPTYNWDVMQRDGYAWWQRRFKKMSEYFTAYRIDHILGFFRIWEIPTHSVHGLLGQFVPALPLSKDDVHEKGLNLDWDELVTPWIDDALIYSVFGSHAPYVQTTFLEQNAANKRWRLKDHCDTQRKIVALPISDGYAPDAWAEIIEGLMQLTNNVLFVVDRTDATKLHPRILAQTAPVFQRLTWQQREAFIEIHDHYFYHRHNQFWYEQAMKKLPALLNAAPMLACGEDLGMVPDCVPWVMNELQILSLEIQRMPKAMGAEFGTPWAYPYRSVCTLSTHDMATLRGWWQEDEALTRRFYHTQLGHGEPYPVKAESWLCQEIVQRNLEAPSIFAVMALQDWFSMDDNLRYPNPDAERINVPANPNHYWGYRMHVTLEDLMAQDEFNEFLAELFVRTQRAK